MYSKYNKFFTINKIYFKTSFITDNQQIINIRKKKFNLFLKQFVISYYNQYPIDEQLKTGSQTQFGVLFFL